MARAKKDDRIKRLILDCLVMKPALKPAAKNAGLNPATLFRWLRESVADPESHRVEWLGKSEPLHIHVAAARKLNILAIEANARDLATQGHSTLKWHGGAPVWETDPEVAADNLSLGDSEWGAKYPGRQRGDVYRRDENGALVQARETSPVNPQILTKLLTSLMPEIYGERSELSVTHQGSVWIEGQPTTPALAAPAGDDFNATFGLTQRPGEAARPTNTLAAPHPCKDSDEFDKRFRKQLLREVVLFQDANGKLMAPLADDVLVIGTPQYRAFLDAGLLDGAQVMTPQDAIDEGYVSDWLLDLAPGYKPNLKPKPEPMPESVPAASAEFQPPPVVEERPGYASSRHDSERLGAGKPPPGGRSIQL